MDPGLQLMAVRDTGAGPAGQVTCVFLGPFDFNLFCLYVGQTYGFYKSSDGDPKITSGHLRRWPLKALLTFLHRRLGDDNGHSSQNAGGSHKGL